MYRVLGIILFFAFFSNKYASASSVLSPGILFPRTTNITTHLPHGWVSEPKGRGSWDLLYSCFTTLSLCAWTAFHPNVPVKESDVRFVFQRLRWMLIAVFLPEVVLYCAWSQWWAARCLKHEVNRLSLQCRGEKVTKEFMSSDENNCAACATADSQHSPTTGSDGQDSSSNHGDQTQNQPNTGSNGHPMSSDHSNQVQFPSTQDSVSTQPNVSIVNNLGAQITNKNTRVLEDSQDVIPWTLDQAYFALSGGIAVDTSSFWRKQRMTLTSKGIVLLAEIGLLPRLTQEDVKDKSKADTIAKALVCVQTIWFLIQGFARVVTGLPLTLLEVHTMTHIACALVMYMIWFKKPYTVSRPTLLQDQDTVNIAALLLTRSNGEADEPLSKNLDPSDDWVLYQKDGASEIPLAPFLPDRCSLKHDVKLESVRCCHPDYSAEPSKILAHFDAANQAVRYLRNNNIHFQWAFSQGGTFAFCTRQYMDHYPSHNFLINYRTNWNIKGRFDGHSTHKKPHGIRRNAALLFSCIYGASHTSAWNFHFPTKIEKWMWRSSCITMVAAPIFAALVLLLRDFDWKLRRVGRYANAEKGIPGRARRLLGMVLITIAHLEITVLAFVVVNSYPFIRLFLLGESLASLRSPANGTYESIDWTFVIPHAS